MLIGAYATPEFTAGVPVPRVTVAVGVTLNVAEAVFPLLSVTVTVCAPLVKSTEPVMVTTTLIEFVVPTSLDPTVPLKTIFPLKPVGFATVPISDPAVVHAVLVVTETVCVTDCVVAPDTVVIAPRDRVPPTAVPVNVVVVAVGVNPVSDHAPWAAVNWKTAVPCSETVADAVERAVLPIFTLLIVALGPNPVTVAVTSVPTGPEAGESVTVAPVEVAP